MGALDPHSFALPGEASNSNHGDRKLYDEGYNDEAFIAMPVTGTTTTFDNRDLMGALDPHSFALPGEARNSNHGDRDLMGALDPHSFKSDGGDTGFFLNKEEAEVPVVSEIAEEDKMGALDPHSFALPGEPSNSNHGDRKLMGALDPHSFANGGADGSSYGWLSKDAKVDGSSSSSLMYGKVDDADADKFAPPPVFDGSN